MSKYILYFNNESSFDNKRSVENYDEPWLSLTEYNLDENIPVTDEEVPDVARVDYNKTEREKLLETPLTFEIQSNGDIVWKATNTGNTKTIEYSKNGGEWTSITSTTGGTSVSVVSGDTVQFRGDNASYGEGYPYYNCFSNTTCNFSVKGNIMSLIDSTNFANLATLESEYTFNNLFRNCTGLTDASNLLLPATTLAFGCYQNMFYICTSLTGAPELPATTLANYCYRYMFVGCTSLTTAPELPATTLAGNCYGHMFEGCTSLTTAPSILPATTLADYCYQGMFQGCTSLTTASELPATALTQDCYSYMFDDCTSLTTAPALPATTLANRCYECMFENCTSLTTAPELPASTLTSKCYFYMFDGCTSLVNGPSSIGTSATTMAASACTYMFYNCTSLTTAPVLPATTLAVWCYGNMFWGCRNLNYIKCLATDISASSCTSVWVYGVAASGTFVKDPSMTGWTTGNNGIPTGWTVKSTNVISIEVGDAAPNSPVEITVYTFEDYVGNCNITVNGTTYTSSVIEGQASFTISGLVVGFYTVYATLPATSLYEECSGSTDFVVMQGKV